MASNARQLCLVCYDIADPKRLGRVHRYLRRRAMPVQYSVFTAHLSPKKQLHLLLGLEEIIDHNRDDVRIYPLSDRLERVILGRQIFPEGIMLFDGGKDLLFLEKNTSNCDSQYGGRGTACLVYPKGGPRPMA